MSRFLALVVFAALLALLPAPVLFAEPPPVTGLHTDLECDDCHEGGPDDLGIYDCIECHAASSNIHPVGVTPQIEVPPHLQLADDGQRKNPETNHGELG